MGANHDGHLSHLRDSRKWFWLMGFTLKQKQRPLLWQEFHIHTNVISVEGAICDYKKNDQIHSFCMHAFTKKTCSLLGPASKHLPFHRPIRGNYETPDKEFAEGGFLCMVLEVLRSITKLRGHFHWLYLTNCIPIRVLFLMTVFAACVCHYRILKMSAVPYRP